MGRNRTAEIAVETPAPGPAETSAPRPARARNRPPSPFKQRARVAVRLAPWVLAVLVGLWAREKLVRFLEEDPRFRLPATEWEAGSQALEIRGVRSVPRHEVLEVFREDLGRSVYRVPLTQRRRQLLAIDWVAGASVARRWPNRLEIRIRERRPVAFVVAGPGSPGAQAGTALMDAEGVLLRWPAQGSFSLPVLWGVSAAQSASERRGRVRLMLELLDHVGPHASRVSEIDVTDPRNVVVTLALEDRAVRLWLGRENFASRLKGFREYYAQIARWAPEARIFDLRVDGQVRAVDAAPPGAGRAGRNGKGEQSGR